MNVPLFMGELVEHVEHPVLASLVGAVLDKVVGTRQGPLMTAVIQFLVLKRDSKWMVKSGDLVGREESFAAPVR